MDKLSAIRAPVVSSSCGGSRLARGHVGFFDGWDVGNRIRLLAGNQGGGVDWDEVCVTSFPQERVLGYRWPLGG